MCHCPGGVAFRLLRLAQQGHVKHPTKRRRGTRHFCDVFLQRIQTNPPVIYGSTKSWNAMVLQPVQRRCAGSCSLEGLVACQPRPKARTTAPAADLAGRPDLIERNFTADAPARKLVGDITYIHTREGFVYLATVTGLLLEKNCWLRHGGTHANRIGPKSSAKLAARNCQPIKGVTIFHVESRDRSTRPLTTPPP